jgi:hypothetical protein
VLAGIGRHPPARSDFGYSRKPGRARLLAWQRLRRNCKRFLRILIGRRATGRDSRAILPSTVSFLSGVCSTRVYCRPVCPVRSARSENVTFYATAAAAERAGFRLCLRCRPETAPGSPAWMGTATTVARGMRMIEEGFLDRESVASLSAALGVGSPHLLRLFMRHAGASPSEVAATRRVQKAK